MKLAFHPVAERIQHGLLSVTLSVALRPPVFHWYPLLQSPDFPLLLKATVIACLPGKFILTF